MSTPTLRPPSFWHKLWNLFCFFELKYTILVHSVIMNLHFYTVLLIRNIFFQSNLPCLFLSHSPKHVQHIKSTRRQRSYRKPAEIEKDSRQSINIYREKGEQPCAGVFKQLSSGWKDYKSYLSIAKSGKLMSFLKKTSSPLWESHLPRRSVVNLLDLNFPSSHSLPGKNLSKPFNENQTKVSKKKGQTIF